MLSIVNLYRIKLSVWFRQMYMPGMRGAAAIILVNVIVFIAIEIMARRLARAATEQGIQIKSTAKRGVLAGAYYGQK